MLFFQNKNKITGFTLIELLIVIVIIGILAVALIPRLTGAQAAARDASRKADLRQLQSAIEMYASEKGSYPNTAGGQWRGVCGSFGSHGTTGSNGYVPNLAPEYMTVLPTDPKPTGGSCYLYRSNGVDYMILVYGTVEGKVPDELKRPSQPLEKNYAVYTQGAKMW